MIPAGYYSVEKDTKIGFGAWSISFKKGQVLRYDEDKKMYSWDADNLTWKLRRPPISGVDTLDLGRYGNQNEQQNEFNKFKSGTKSITKKQAEELTKKLDINDVEALIEQAGINVKDGMIKKSDLPKVIAIIKKMKHSS